ncbi:MAG: hypothetical protein LJE61_12960 [Thiocapsa sp.]|jgi:hypothetical protein|nr:hypothetical protein [Thiocapsa sp.]MCG6986094.1 hypothetical protein [Thiocapsa sp.]
MTDDLHIPLDRVTYRDGQRLTAQDLRDDLRHTERRWRLHSRGLHDTWGIALGLGVVRVGADEGRGPMVRVEPGYAVDALGRDILLSVQVDVPIPDLGEPLVLTMRHLEDAAFRRRAERAFVCLGSGLDDPRTERPAFQWRRQSEVQFGAEIPLTQLWPAVEQPDPRVRRYARTLVHPHIAWGETEAGRTGWKYIDNEFSPQYGLYVDVDTSVAGFDRSPFYFAQLIGDLSPITSAGRSDASTLQGETARFSDLYGYLSETGKRAFRFRVCGPYGDAPDPSTAAEQIGWRVFWIGVEPMGGCRPTFDPSWAHFIVPFLSFFHDYRATGPA